MKTLTVSSIAELVPTSSNQLTQHRIEPDLSHDAALLALIDYYEGLIASGNIERDAIIDEVKVIDGRVHITWYGYLPVDMKICIHFAIERYIEVTTSTKNDEVPIVTETLPKTSEETLEVIEDLKDEFENYISLYEIRNRLKHLTRFEQDEAIYALMRKDIIELSKLNEPWFYSDEQRSAGIPTPVGGDWFFAILN